MKAATNTKSNNAKRGETRPYLVERETLPEGKKEGFSLDAPSGQHRPVILPFSRVSLWLLLEKTGQLTNSQRLKNWQHPKIL